MQNVTLKVADMHCNSCPKLIKVTLEEMSGVKAVETSLETKLVKVSFESPIMTPKLLIDAIKEVGYSAEIQQ